MQQPPDMRTVRRGVWVLALLAVALTAWTTVRETRRPRRSPFGDFCNLQTGAQCLVDGCDPYLYSSMNADIAARHENKPPVWPMAPVYPTNSLMVLLPFEGLRWPVAAYVFNGLAGLATAIACAMFAWWLRIRVWDPAAAIMLVGLVSLPMASALEFANPALSVAAMMALACLLLLRRHASVLGWLLLGLALALKPQLAVGAALALVCRRDTRAASLKACGLAVALLLAGLLAYRLRLGSFQFLASLRWALGLAALPGGSSDFANTESFDFLNVQGAFWAIPHLGRFGASALAWLTTGAMAAGSWWIARKRDALRRFPWTMIALAVAISLLPVYHRGYDRVIALVLVPAAVEVGRVSRRLAWVYAAIVAWWIANFTVMLHVLRRFKFAPQNGVEDVLFCCALLLALWWSGRRDLIASEA